MKPEDQGQWQIQEEAAEWVELLRSSEASRPQPAFQSWYSQSKEHRREFALAGIVDQQLAGLRRLPRHSIERLLTEPDRPVRLARPDGRLRNVAWLAAASLSTLVLGIIFWSTNPRTSLYATAIGEQRRIVLEDGTTVQLNTHSRIAVSYGRLQRRIDLIEGEAQFDVHADRRPFRVYSGTAIVEDIGTRFVVKNIDESLSVVVAEGRVRVTYGEESTAEGIPTPALELRRGQGVTIRRGLRLVPTARSLTAEQLRSALDWRQGWLSMSGQPLTAVVGELNRYHRRKLVIADPSIGNLQLGGRVSITDLDEFAMALKPLGVRMVEDRSDDGEGRILLVEDAALLR